MRPDVARLTAHTRLLSDPPLWCWEIVDAVSGAVVASSWQGEWKAYPSSDEALREATPALLAMARGRRLAQREATPPPTLPSGSLARSRRPQ
ncbi:MAG: hypothetical protein ACREM3_20735 [Candidatus Rokuibacteriota bacterium]